MKLDPTPDNRCGTYAGWNAHQKRGEWTCDACKQAARTYMAARRADPAKRAEERRRQQAATRARWRLVRMNPGLYRALVEEELRR
jgi:hypothetical protein